MPAELLTLRDYLRWAVSLFEEAKLYYGHGTTRAIDEAAFMILEGLHLPIDELEPFLDARLLPAEKDRLDRLIHARIETRKPAAYLLQRAYIRGTPFYVDERVIVPRSYLGEILFADVVPTPPEVNRVLDLCTGSGCLAILAAHVYPHAHIDALDISEDALEVAERNVTDFGLNDRIQLIQGSVTDLGNSLPGHKYDLILTNPPYVDEETMVKLPPEYRAEPVLALAGGVDGLDLVRDIIQQAPDYLTQEGGLLCEIGLGRDMLEADYPNMPFTWLDTQESEGEVFWISRKDME